MAKKADTKQKIFVNETSYTIDGKKYDRVSSIIGAFNTAYDSIPVNILEEAALRGSMAHQCMELYLTKQIKRLKNAESLLNAYNAKTFRKWINAKEWIDENVKKCILAEHVVFSDMLGYAGTLDALCIDNNNDYFILDLKTGSEQKTHRLQMGAYYLAHNDRGVKNAKLLYADEKKVKIINYSKQEIEEAENDFKAVLKTFRIFGVKNVK